MTTFERVGDLLHISPRFFRSVLLGRDFYDSSALNGYILTDFAKECFQRIAHGLKPDSGLRAWRITGDYGSGKSSFALLLARSLANPEDVPSGLRRSLDLPKCRKENLLLAPVLCTCSRRPLAVSLVEAVGETVRTLYAGGRRPRLASEIENLLASGDEPSDDQVIALLEKVNGRAIGEGKAGGMLLVIDELGKFLEHAALHPSRHDVFLLQRIAEMAARSGPRPFFVVCLLHQGFSEYADGLDPAAQREWEKVAGRFEEVVLDQPTDQIAHLIASALSVRVQLVPEAIAASLKMAMAEAVDLGWYGRADRSVLVDLAVALYPLHPTVLPVLVRLFRRFAQNERSLFSFLLSGEPFGLQAFCDSRVEDTQYYRLHHLFDYVRANLGHRLAARSYRSHWNLIEAVIDSYATDDALQVEILKTVGIMNLLGDEVAAAEDVVVCAVASADDRCRQKAGTAVHKLRDVKRVLYERGRGRGLCLWPYTCVDIERAYEEARRAVQVPHRVASLISEHLETIPIVARRHYIERGSLRHFDVRFCSVADLPARMGEEPGVADGVIVVALCETPEERETALQLARTQGLKGLPNVLLAVPQPLASLAGLVQELQRWEWVVGNTLELNVDKYAREEVSRQLRAARLQLDARVRACIGLRQFGGRTTIDWFCKGKLLDICDGRSLLSLLSEICDQTYSQAPRIHNELVNRRSLSSAAAAARMRLIERMYSHGRRRWLGMDATRKPPEMSMYLSVLSNTGIHRQEGEEWLVAEPADLTEDRCNVLPTLSRIGDIIRQEEDARVGIDQLFEELRRPPFGLRDGLLPLLLAAYGIAHEQEVAFYKDGTFIREMTGQLMLELTKAPERFEIQYCKIEGVRAEVFARLMGVLGLRPSSAKSPEVLDVVRPLCQFVAQLPGYVQNTRRVSSSSGSVRDAILAAREPSGLLFAALPQALGLTAIQARASGAKEVQVYVTCLKSALDELRTAYLRLQERMRNGLRTAFHSPPGPFQQFRTSLAGRAERVVLGATEPRLRAFCLRLMDQSLAESEWLESLGSFLALRPPAKWHDADEDLFAMELAQLAERFQRVESIVFSGCDPAAANRGIRLSVTFSNGEERQQVIHFTAEEQGRLGELQRRFESFLSDDRRLGLAAASIAILAKLSSGGSSEHE